ncbi:hypothetical protein KC678_03155 [Candidatus Dojkabacteria bacterium]|uniref:Uncharacterized protein n=1 Tax=Candidatus Dojkabacteria bacterium TaxID=2099670 RepID=A0A955IFF4_9BACT|nr:hypothetical protein [Candidatus Dojkabacteria bacterium]
MNDSKLGKITDALKSEAKKNLNKHLIQKMRDLEQNLLKITWIFFIIGFFIFFNISIIVLFITKLLTDSEEPITYYALFVGFCISLVVGCLVGFLWKTREYIRMKAKFESIFRVEDF